MYSKRCLPTTLIYNNVLAWDLLIGAGLRPDDTWCMLFAIESGDDLWVDRVKKATRRNSCDHDKAVRVGSGKCKDIEKHELGMVTWDKAIDVYEERYNNICGAIEYDHLWNVTSNDMWKCITSEENITEVYGALDWAPRHLFESSDTKEISDVSFQSLSKMYLESLNSTMEPLMRYKGLLKSKHINPKEAKVSI